MNFFAYILLLLSVTPNLFAQIPLNGLVAYYPFNGNANDASGNGYNGTVYGATLTNGAFGNANSAYSYDGIDDWIDIGNTTICSNADGLAVACWARSPGFISVGGAIFERSDDQYLGGQATRIFRLSIESDGVIHFGVNNLPPSQGIWVNTPSNTFQFNNTWQHIAATYDSYGGLYIYVDGIQAAYSNLTAGNISNLSIRTNIGQKYNSIPAQLFKGDLDEVCIYDRALSSSEINQLLPVELKGFSAILIGDHVKLSWSTATEVNNYGFEIERTNLLENNSWYIIGFVDGHGTSNTANSYEYLDTHSSWLNDSENIYYRLKQIDLDGQTKYSMLVIVTSPLPNTIYLGQNYPNPFDNVTIIPFALAKPSAVNISIYDVYGRKIETIVNGYYNAGKYSDKLETHRLTRY